MKGSRAGVFILASIILPYFSTADPLGNEIIGNRPADSTRAIQSGKADLHSYITDLGSNTPKVRAAAALSLARSGEVETTALIVKAFIEETDSEARVLMARALLALRSPSALPALFAYPEIFDSKLDLLAPLARNELAFPYLIEGLDNSSTLVRRFCLIQLVEWHFIRSQKFDPRKIGLDHRIIDFIVNEPDLSTRIAAYGLLEEIGDVSALDFLATRSIESAVEARALLSAIGIIGMRSTGDLDPGMGDRTAELCRSYLSAKDMLTVGWAIFALTSTNIIDRDDVRRINSIFSLETTSTWVKVAAAFALLQSHDGRGREIEILREYIQANALSVPHKSVQKAVVSIVISVFGNQSADLFTTALDYPISYGAGLLGLGMLNAIGQSDTPRVTTTLQEGSIGRLVHEALTQRVGELQVVRQIKPSDP